MSISVCGAPALTRPGGIWCFRGEAPDRSWLAFATESIGVFTKGSNVVYEPHSAALAVTANGGHEQTGKPAPQSSTLPLLPGDWSTTVLIPAIVPHTQDVIVPVLMQRPFPPKSAPLKTW